MFGMKWRANDELVDSFEFHVSCHDANAWIDESKCRAVLVNEGLVSSFVAGVVRHVDGEVLAYLSEVEAVDGVVDVAFLEIFPEGPHVVDRHHMRIFVETRESRHSWFCFVISISGEDRFNFIFDLIKRRG